MDSICGYKRKPVEMLYIVMDEFKKINKTIMLYCINSRSMNDDMAKWLRSGNSEVGK